MQESYTLTQAMKLAGISPGNIANWRRRLPELEKNPYINPPRGNKRSASLDLTGVIYLVIVGRLNKIGLGPGDAAKCADYFLDLVQTHGADIHEAFKSKMFLVVDRDAGNPRATRKGLPIRARTLAATSAALDFESKRFPDNIKIMLNLSAIYDEATALPIAD